MRHRVIDACAVALRFAAATIERKPFLCTRFFMKKGLRPLALRQWTTRQENGNDASNKSPPCGGGFPNRRETWD